MVSFKETLVLRLMLKLFIIESGILSKFSALSGGMIHDRNGWEVIVSQATPLKGVACVTREVKGDAVHEYKFRESCIYIIICDVYHNMYS